MELVDVADVVVWFEGRELVDAVVLLEDSVLTVVLLDEWLDTKALVCEGDFVDFVLPWMGAEVPLFSVWLIPEVPSWLLLYEASPLVSEVSPIVEWTNELLLSGISFSAHDINSSRQLNSSRKLIILPRGFNIVDFSLRKRRPLFWLIFDHPITKLKSVDKICPFKFRQRPLNKVEGSHRTI